MKLVWSRFALSDRDGIFSYIEAENPRAAVHVDEQIANAARLKSSAAAVSSDRGCTKTPVTLESLTKAFIRPARTQTKA